MAWTTSNILSTAMNREGRVLFWDISTGNLSSNLHTIDTRRAISSLVWSGKDIITSYKECFYIQLWDGFDQSQKNKYQACFLKTPKNTYLTYGPESSLLIGASYNQILCWSCEDKTKKTKIIDSSFLRMLR
ncbi:predicted protein [Naegleria gruberi]|uniref:Predicted protein n=1 Tax=Naegleria gruberi TaxID=5762 RepID=D2VUB7_NAEGR|nr:uncharacterized protein NAEGRDRAFT_72606 [Naegleria gruberi]EFC39598.1 predicted protein [Naegleria gruberi]|eukprot:XP_002672342.1 predicted protein [Naegleria gruberi strain NEG-M]